MSAHPSPVPAIGLVEMGSLRQSGILALVGRNTAFLLVGLVYLGTANWTPAGVGLFGALAVWSGYRLLTRRIATHLLAIDVSFVIVAGLLEPLIVPATVDDLAMAVTRMIAYPAIVMVAISEPKRMSVPVLLVISGATAVGDVMLFGSPNGTLVIFFVNWLAAVWVRRLILRSAAATDAADASVRRVRLREQVANARIRFEREQFATLHDTAASTLMMVADRPGLDRDRLAAQAARDVAILSEASAVANAQREVDLVEDLVRVTDEFVTPVTIESAGPVPVPMPIAASVTAAVREALNNVDRHSRATAATITTAPQRVVVSDDGIGFDSRKARRGFGLRGSIDERMRRAGGSSLITSRPGAGTTVELTWPELPADDVVRESPDAARVLRGYQLGLAIAQLLVLAELVLIAFGGFAGVGSGFTAFVVVVLFATSPIVVMMMRGRFTAARWVAIAAVVVCGTFYVAQLPANQLVSAQNWVATSVGWALAALFAGWVGTRKRVMLAAGFVTSVWIVETAVMVWRVPERAVVEYAGYGIASLATLQVASVFFAWLLAESARVAERLGDEQHATATQLAVEHALQEDYRLRFAQLTREVIDLLSGLADRSLDPELPSVRQRAHVEYARLRRLFAQAESFEHPLIEQLRPVLDAAGERGIAVAFDIAERPPDLADHDIAAIAAAVDGLVSGASDRVRLVVSSAGERVTVSVVSDCPEAARARVSEALVDSDYQLTVDGRVTWLRVHAPVLVAV